MKLADELQRAFEYGQQAALRGEPVDACRYRKGDKCNAWVRGWNDGQEQLERHVKLTEEQKAAGRAGVQKLRALLMGR
ncbi:MAG: hypothetical protein GY862_01080 [Gammaproteobacteria bacterium]|nr:hypothetical protein [Gammaproteobacteria bacterium]